MTIENTETLRRFYADRRPSITPAQADKIANEILARFFAGERESLYGIGACETAQQVLREVVIDVLGNNVMGLSS